MAYPNKMIHNPVTGQSIRFLKTAQETEGSLLEMEASFTPHSVEPVAHYHPYQVENFFVVAGSVSAKINGQQQNFTAGDTFQIAAGVVHAMWNSSSKPVVLNWKVSPAFDTEYLLETGMGLARDGKTDETGMPGILQIALTMNKFSDVFRLAKPPFMVQKFIFGMLMPVSLLTGRRATYKHHLD